VSGWLWEVRSSVPPVCTSSLLPMQTGRGREHHGEILRSATRFAEEGRRHPHPLVDPRRHTLGAMAEAHAEVRQGISSGTITADVDA
jgi:NADPH:quinone reductase